MAYQVPHNDEAERQVIGGLVFDPSLAAEIASQLKPEDFYDGSCRKCYEVILQDFQAGREVTPLTVAEKAKQDPSWIIDAMAGTIGPIQVREYVRLVKEHSRRRQIIRLASEAAQKARDTTTGEEGLAAVLNELQQELFAATKGEGEDWEMNLSLITRHFATIEKRKGTNGVTGIPSGFPDLDKLTAGWQPGQLIFLGAVPKMGKTSMALHFALHSKVPTLFFTLEMLPEEIADRQFASVGKIPAQKIKTGNLRDEDWPKLVEAGGKLAEAPLGWVKKAGLTVTQMKAICRRFQAEHGLGLVVIDQLDKIYEKPLHDENRSDTIGRTTRALKIMAMDLQVPVICLLQLLDKQVSKRAVPRPAPGDVRDSSYPEQDADLMLYLWRPSFYWPNKKQYENKAEVIISRQRSGAAGSVWLTWLPEYTAFGNLPWTEWPQEEW